ncbi:MAG: hypothetical protein WD768_11035 [Phycisphaeraceae bacterium]
MKPNLILLITLAAALFCLQSSAFSQVPKKLRPPNDATDTYEVLKLRGWTLRISHRFKPHDDLKKEVLEEVDSQLRRITLLVGEKALAELRKTEIWIEHEFPGRAQYHPNRQWLTDNGYNPEKTGTIEIAHAKGFLEWRDRTVMTLLHELAHAYHDKSLGFEEPRVIAAYEAAKKSGRYDKILRDKGYMIKHYAMDNHKEYFAEMVEAYFWCNDYYPFVYGELKEFDPQGFKVMEDIFGKRFEDDPRVHEEGKKKEVVEKKE